MEFRLPELGEGIESGTVVKVLVHPGATVRANQDVIQVETDKASIAVPIDKAGTVGEVRVKPGDKVSVGDILFTLEGSGAAKMPATGGAPKSPPPPPAAPARQAPAPAAAATATAAATKAEFRVPDLGEGIESARVTRVNVQAGVSFKAKAALIEVETEKATLPVEAPAAGSVDEVRVSVGDTVTVGKVIFVLTLEGSAGKAAPAPAKSPAAAPAPAPASKNGVHSPPPPPAAVRPAEAAPPTPAHLPVPAGPATRRLARELQVDLRQVRGSARGGRVTPDDVKAFVRGKMDQLKSAPAAGTASAGPVAQPPMPDFSKYGAIEKQAVTTLRKTIARNMGTTWATCPMVTQFDKADVTDLEAGRKRVSDSQPKGAAKITMTVLAVKAVVAALKQFPNFNASFDAAAGELILKKYFHVGIAVDTEKGLVVPVIRDADRKSVHDIAKEVQTLAESARAGTLTIDQMRGGSFTITNLGGIGGTAFTPIINWPEVAILGMARSAMEPVYKDGTFVPRLMLPLCLTYDHRVIDGADGARFTARLNTILSDPIRLLMES